MISIELDTSKTKKTVNFNNATTFIKLNLQEIVISETLFTINNVELIDTNYHYSIAVTNYSKKFFLNVSYPECPTFVLEKKDRNFFNKDNVLYIGAYEVEFLLLFKTKEERDLFKKGMKKAKWNRFFNPKKPRSRKASP